MKLIKKKLEILSVVSSFKYRYFDMAISPKAFEKLTGAFSVDLNSITITLRLLKHEIELKTIDKRERNTLLWIALAIIISIIIW